MSDKSPNLVESELPAIRDTFESIWVAIVLAFVLRAFMIEAFVIPTGSMAPRLMGAHWQLECTSCGYSYPFGMDRNYLRKSPRQRAGVFTQAFCPSCGYRHDPMSGETHRRGDQVLVMKYLYHFRAPEPWDVVVFKNPQNNRENYIKRLIGLPGEVIEIVHGDIFVVPRDGNEFRVRRKGPKAQRAMWHVLFDNDYRPRAELHWARSAGNDDDRRRPVPAWARSNPDDPRWQTGGKDGSRKLTFSGGGEGPASLVFTLEHPDYAGSRDPRRVQDVRDFFLPHYGYNNRSVENQEIDSDVDVCTDLRLSAVYWPGGEGASAVGLTLTSLGWEFRAELTSQGAASLYMRNPGAGQDAWVRLGGEVKLPPTSPGRGVKVALQHADYRVAMFVDGREVLATTDEEYDGQHAWIKQRVEEARRDPIPVPTIRIHGAGGPFALSHVKLWRDVYYTTPDLDVPDLSGGMETLLEYQQARGVRSSSPGWATTGRPLELRWMDDRSQRRYDEFFVLGDNSPQSLDGRGWLAAARTLDLYRKQSGEGASDPQPLYKLGTVPRYNLIGKAFFVYWPAGFPIPHLRNWYWIVPNVGKMRLIR
jgi:signal peptidase I